VSTTMAMVPAGEPGRSVFAGLDVCAQAGLKLPGTVRPAMFEDDSWDFTQVIGLPNQMSKASRRFDFTSILNPRWRLVAKGNRSWPCSPLGTRWWRRCPAPTAPRCIW
jgi:hypothetical protein